jgi:DNA replication protein DnaC
MGPNIRRYLEELLQRRPDLVMSDEERTALEAAEKARAHERQLAKADLRLAALREQLPDHYGWAEQYPRARWTQIREQLRTILTRRPSGWVLMGSTAGNAKTTALVAEGIRAIRAGRSVAYVAGRDWRARVQQQHLHDLEAVDLLLVDEIHWLASLPAWITAEAMGVIDYRYQRRKTHQTLAAGTLPIAELINGLPPGLADRFDYRIGAAEDSQRRKK